MCIRDSNSYGYIKVRPETQDDFELERKCIMTPALSKGPLYIANTVSPVRNNKIVLSYINLSDKQFHLKKGIILGNSYPLISKSAEEGPDISGHKRVVSANVATCSKGLSKTELRQVYREIIEAKMSKEDDENSILEKPEYLEDLLNLLMEFHDVLALDDDAVPVCPLQKFKIELLPDAPKVIFRKQYRLPHRYLQDIDDFTESALKKGYIKAGYSPHSSPLLVVAKKNSSKPRVCLDYRYLNSHSVQDVFPLPSIDEIFTSLGGNTVFTSVDLLDAYNALEIEEETQKLMAFRTRKGLWCPTRLMFGHKNAPSIYARTMTMALNHMLGPVAQVYLDDVLILGRNVTEHFENLKKVLTVFRENKLRIKLSKCSFLQSAVLYLGFKIGRDGISPDPAKVETMKSFVPPTNVKETQSLLGFFSYFRFLIKDFAAVAQPLYDLIKKDVPFL